MKWDTIIVIYSFLLITGTFGLLGCEFLQYSLHFHSTFWSYRVRNHLKGKKRDKPYSKDHSLKGQDTEATGNVTISEKAIQILLDLRPQFGLASQSLSKALIKWNTCTTPSLNDCNPGSPSCIGEWLYELLSGVWGCLGMMETRVIAAGINSYNLVWFFFSLSSRDLQETS